MDLITETVMDCSGRVTHRLRLHLDGLVEVVDARGSRALIDPVHQVCLTPGMSVATHVMDIAVGMASLGIE